MSTRPRDTEDSTGRDFVTDRARERAHLIAALEGDSPANVDAEGRSGVLADRFGLSAFETDVVRLLWCCAFDPQLRASIVQGEWGCGQITVQFAAQLFGHEPRARLPSESPLLQWRIVREHELIDGGAVLAIDPMINAWLDGAHELDSLLVGHATLIEPGPELASWPTDSTVSRLRELSAEGRRVRVRILSDDALAARWFTGAVGRRLGLPILATQPKLPEAAGDGAIRLHRQAFLDGCAPCFAAEEAVLADPHGVPPYPLQFVYGTNATLEYRPDTVDLEVRLEPPGPEEREHLWRRLWRRSATWQGNRLADLALCHEADISDIAAVAASCPANAEAAGLSLRARLRRDMGTLARPIDACFDWDDLVVAPRTAERLNEIAFEARERLRLWSEPKAARLFPYGRGLVALFAGPPGTGKTMAAQVIAAGLGLDLHAVDISQCISKWVGETAQNLQRLLSSREARHSILFFDEADALYAKRVEELRDAQDRFANYDSSFLMTALERHSGVVILATNLKANIDSAFLRRIRHVVDFDFPDASARQAIWGKAIEALFPRAQARRLLTQLNQVAQIEASGALIKNAALSASFSARRTGNRPDARLLAEMLARELGKEGAGLSDRDLDAILEQQE